MADTIIEAQTVELTEPEVAPEAPKAPTREELRSKGWTAAEMDSAEKRGMVAKAEEPKKPEPKAEVPKVEPEVKAEPNVEEPKKPEVRGALPDFTLKTPEQEKAFLDAFGPGTAPRAMYFRMKNERHARQAVEARARELEARLAVLEAAPKAPAPPPEGEDPENQPLTLKQLRELQKAESDAIQKQQEEHQERVARVVEAQKAQEDYARAIYPDFDDGVNRAKEVMQNLEALLPEPWKQAKAVKLIRELQTAAANADKIGLDEYHAALIAYEIGQMHPDHGKKAETTTTGTPKVDPKANGGLTPEQMKRAEQNTQRRGSSAAVPAGGGKRAVSPEDVTLADFATFDAKKRLAFREKHPEAYARLSRG